MNKNEMQARLIAVNAEYKRIQQVADAAYLAAESEIRDRCDRGEYTAAQINAAFESAWQARQDAYAAADALVDAELAEQEAFFAANS